MKFKVGQWYRAEDSTDFSFQFIKCLRSSFRHLASARLRLGFGLCLALSFRFSSGWCRRFWNGSCASWLGNVSNDKDTDASWWFKWVSHWIHVYYIDLLYMYSIWCVYIYIYIIYMYRDLVGFGKDGICIQTHISTTNISFACKYIWLDCSKRCWIPVLATGLIASFAPSIPSAKHIALQVP